MLTVCNYHYIREDFSAPYPSIFGVTPKEFEKQLKLLANSGDFIHPTEFLSDIDSCLAEKSKYNLITFDDGLKEQYDLALLILASLDIPAVFFANSINREETKVSTVHKIHLLRTILSPVEFSKLLIAAKAPALSDSEMKVAIGTYRYDDPQSAAVKYLLNFKMDFIAQETVIKPIFEAHFNEAETVEKLYMSQQQYIDLAQNGFLGSHTHSHYPLGLLPDDKLKFELSHSKNYFETVTGHEISLVSYPYGTKESCPDVVAEIAKQAGYKAGFTTDRGQNGPSENQMRLKRFDCNDLPGGKNFK